MHLRSWSEFKKRVGRVHVPRLHPGEAEALHRAEWVRRQAEQQHEQARVEAELARHQALVDAGIEPVPPPAETTVEGFTNQQF